MQKLRAYELVSNCNNTLTATNVTNHRFTVNAAAGHGVCLSRLFSVITAGSQIDYNETSSKIYALLTPGQLCQGTLYAAYKSI